MLISYPSNAGDAVIKAAIRNFHGMYIQPGFPHLEAISACPSTAAGGMYLFFLQFQRARAAPTPAAVLTGVGFAKSRCSLCSRLACTDAGDDARITYHAAVHSPHTLNISRLVQCRAAPREQARTLLTQSTGRNASPAPLAAATIQRTHKSPRTPRSHPRVHNSHQRHVPVPTHPPHIPTKG